MINKIKFKIFEDMKIESVFDFILINISPRALITLDGYPSFWEALLRNCCKKWILITTEGVGLWMVYTQIQLKGSTPRYYYK